MSFSRVLRGGLMIVAISAGGSYGDGGGHDQCGVIPPYIVKLPCRDGGACDLDRTCDGMCIVATFLRPAKRLTPEGVGGCYVAARLFSQRPGGKRWGSRGITPVRAGAAYDWDGDSPARLRYKCRRARRSCVPPSALGSVTVSGEYEARFSTRSYAVEAVEDVIEPYFQLHLFGDSTEPDERVFIFVKSARAVGSFAAVDSMMYGSLQVRDDAGIDRFESGPLVDGELAIAGIEASDTAASVVHGTLRATFGSTTQGGRVVVEAAF